MIINDELFKIAYKKLKSSFYYDKTLSFARDDLVHYEASGNIDKKLERLYERFIDDNEREKLYLEIINSISYLSFPKKMASDDENPNLISNYSSNSVKIEEYQYFININTEGHILGVLWLLLIGYKVDEKIYNHSYGNRIRKKLINEFSERPTFSPYLFEPYFHQYESWRDKALIEAKKQLEFGNDAYILTLDIRRFYYSLNISERFMDDVLKLSTDMNNIMIRSLNRFIFDVIIKYSSLFNDKFENRNILPIGFLPSNVLSNYALRNLDKAISDYWNPLYYGRYVDDIVIVDKVENNSYFYDLCRNRLLTSDDMINRVLLNCEGWKNNSHNNERAIVISERTENNVITYQINPIYNPHNANDKTRLELQREKLKFFYFRADGSDAMIHSFLDHINENKSEFRQMPDVDIDIDIDDFYKMYEIKNTETINKIRGITKISINKYEFSKMLGKYLRVCGLVEINTINIFIQELKKALNSYSLIENYTLWEHIFEIFVINEKWSDLAEIVSRIVIALHSDFIENNTLESLLRHLGSSLTRALSLIWGKGIDQFYECFDQYDHLINIKTIVDDNNRYAYLDSHMLNQLTIPILIDIIDKRKLSEVKNETVNLSQLDSILRFSVRNIDKNYIYCPYIIPFYSFSLIRNIEKLLSDDNRIIEDNIKEEYNQNYSRYLKMNYNVNINKTSSFDYNNPSFLNEPCKVNTCRNHNHIDEDSNFYNFIEIESVPKNKLKIAIANVSLDHDDFGKIVIGKPNRSHERYNNFVSIVNAAIKEKVDMLVLPENYLPLEWLSILAYKCKNNNIAVITGIEHFIHNGNAYNYSAVILPYNNGFVKDAYISYHLKTHYAPEEKSIIESYGLKPIEGNSYELYKWHDCYFPFYCCYELASIKDRSVFTSIADFLIAIEWNHDINYYSNIIESLSRDLHCYCVQDNYSDWGDSRITKPAKSESKDIIRVKGGINSTILVDSIDIEKLRSFQIKGYYLQQKDKDSFKPTPPGFRVDIVLKKIAGENIFDCI